MTSQNIAIRKEYEGGTKIAVWFPDEDGGLRVVIPPNGSEPPQGEFIRVPRRNSRYRASIIARLCERNPSLSLRANNESIVPTEIAIGPRPQLAAYLYGINGWSKAQIAFEMKVDQSSVNSYLSRFDKGD